MYRCRHFLAESAARALTIPDVPATDLHVLIHTRWNASCLARPSAAPASSRCEPVPAFRLLPGPSTRPAWLSAASTSARYEPISPNRLTPASRGSGSWSGTMAAGAREQAASCDAFVLSRRPPAPEAPPIRTSPLCLIAKPFPEPSPNHGPVTSWPGLPLRIPSGSVKGPLPDSVLAVGGATDGVWQGGSVMSTLRRGPCRASRHDRGRRKPQRDPRRHPERPSATPKNRRHPPKKPPNPEKSAKNHENMAKRAKNVLLAIPSGGGFLYFCSHG